MDWLYRIFYIVFAMGVAATVLFPLLLLFRVLTHNLPKKSMLWLWRLYFLRIVCPVALSSPFCITAGWNRWFHRFMSGLGLTMKTHGGLLQSWSSVLRGEITTTLSYRVCAWLWLFGMVFLLVIMQFRQRQIRRSIRDRATHLTGRLYESKEKVSVMTGVFRLRFYTPAGMGAKQTKYTVAHMQSHEKQKSALWRLAAFIIVSLHWFNPFAWLALYLHNRDEEMACDEETVCKLGAAEKNEYTQSILNMSKEDEPTPYTVSIIYETNLAQRAQRILHWQKPTARQTLTGFLLCTILIFYCFLLRPFQMAWDGGTWGQGQNVQESAKESKKAQDGDVLAEVSAPSPSGLERTLKLILQKGAQAGEEIRGRFSLVLEDSVGNTVAEVSLRDAFRKQDIDLQDFTFPKGLTLRIGDYNNDQIQEILIGQQVNWNDGQRETVNTVISSEGASADAQDNGKQNEEEKAQGQTDASVSVKEYVYLVFNLEETEIKVVSEPVYSQQKTGMEILTPGAVENVKDIFYTSLQKGRIYYVWNQSEQKYIAQKMSEEQLNQHAEASQGTESAGVQKAFYLKDDNGMEKMRVDTLSDTTGSREIKDVIMSNGSRAMPSVMGYFCDIQWAVQSDGTTGRYALLTYNGTKAQTFIVYDVEERKELYRHEDGNTLLSQVFGQYNDSQIRFKAGSAVVYTLLEQKGNILTISFAAEAQESVTVRGTYDYDIEKKEASNLQFSQTGDTAQDTSSGETSEKATGEATPLPTINSNLWDYL